MIQPGRRHFAASRRTVAACSGLAGRLVGVAAPDFDGEHMEERATTARQALAALKQA